MDYSALAPSKVRLPVLVEIAQSVLNTLEIRHLAGLTMSSVLGVLLEVIVVKLTHHIL